MTDEDQNLTPARPVAPRHRLPANPQMAQPIRPTDPERERPSDPLREIPTANIEKPAVPVEVDARVEVAPQVAEPVDEKEEGQLVPVPMVRVESVAVAPEPLAAAAETPTPIAAPQPPVASPPPPAVAPAPPVAAPPPTIEQPSSPPPVAQPAAVASEQVELTFPRTMRDTLRRVDAAWAGFRGAAGRFPSERMDERLSEDGWTRKQMLEHVAAWHDLTADRLVKLITTGTTPPLDRDTDRFNAAVARQAIGKTSGEVVKDMDATFNRLRRQMSRLTDAQLEVNEWWAAYVIGGNTYGHYEEHWADIYTPELPAGGRDRR